MEIVICNFVPIDKRCSYVSAGGNISVSSTLLRSNRLAALEVNKQDHSRREGRDAFCGHRNPFAADTIDNFGVSLGAGNVMLGNGLDGVMHTGGGGERGLMRPTP